MSKYEDFLEYYAKVQNYKRMETLIEWDMQTKAPRTGIDGLANAFSAASAKVFSMETSDEMGKFLDELSQPEVFDGLENYQKAVVTNSKKYYERNRKMPVEFVEEYSLLTAKAADVWQQAKRADNYKMFEPYLKKVVAMTKKKAEYLRQGDESLYDVLLNEYEEGMLSDTIDVLFHEIKEELIPLVKKITQKKQAVGEDFSGNYPVETQKKWSRELLEYIGFSLESGVMGESEHPFTTALSKRDVRLTDHYETEDVIDAVFSIIHEGGHGIFEQNVGDEYDVTPLYSCRHLGLHESQSRFFENILGRNIHFWEPIYERMQKIFPEYRKISLDAFYRKINEVRPSLIRTSSDEVTYCFHIIVRYEIERELFEGKLKTEDIPERWNEKMQQYLGVVPEHDSEGALQDTHWSGGAFGYFPSYLLGSVYDGMFLETIEKELGSVDELLKNGEIKKITSWFNVKIHHFGSSRTPQEVIETVCKKEVSAKPLMKYFREKYGRIYHLDLY